MTLPNILMSALEIIEFVKTIDYYPNVSNFLSNLINVVDDCSICTKKFFKIKIIEILLKFVNVAKNIKWSKQFYVLKKNILEIYFY